MAEKNFVDVVLKYSRAVHAITSDSRRLVSVTVSRHSESFPASIFLITIHPSASQLSFYSTDLTFAVFSIHIPSTSSTSSHTHGRLLRSFRNFVGEEGNKSACLVLQINRRLWSCGHGPSCSDGFGLSYC